MMGSATILAAIKFIEDFASIQPLSNYTVALSCFYTVRFVLFCKWTVTPLVVGKLFSLPFLSLYFTHLQGSAHLHFIVAVVTLVKKHTSAQSPLYPAPMRCDSSGVTRRLWCPIGLLT
jgi:hypothetical protein